MTVPPPISASRLVTDWTLDPVPLCVSIVAGVLYGIGVRRLRQRGRTWPAARTVAFGAGLAVILVATQSGLARYDTVLFSAHVVQHLLLAMAAPVLLALGAPMTLALQAAHRPTQQNLIRLLDQPVVRGLTHPVTAWLLFGTTLFVLYFTALYELSLRNAVVHGLVHVHFLLSGCLFAWAVVGLDPGWRSGSLTYPARVLLVLLMVPFHAVLGIALLGSESVLAGEWYTALDRTWGASPLADQRTGAGLLWGIGDLTAVVLAGVVLYQWMQADEREARRLDRAASAK